MTETSSIKLKELFGDWRWRLNNLYYITDDTGQRVQFKPNPSQLKLIEEMHYLNLILKARQLGFTTFIQLFMLDACVFNSNIRAGTIAHTLGDAQTIFRDKVKFPYDNLPEQLRAAVAIKNDNLTELLLTNNSSIRVGTSLRSGTLQYLHISEYGKICAKFPDKAREVRTGSLNTIAAGQLAFIESTAEGREGHFFDLCEEARAKLRRHERLTELDFKFTFWPWYDDPAYRLNPEDVTIPAELLTYFRSLEKEHGVYLDPAQRAWYAKKLETQLEDMKREYPSTPDEAFEASVEGAYYGSQMAQAEFQGRVGDYPHLPTLPVHTVWDIGKHDYTAIWFFQVHGGKICLVGYYQNSGESAPFYADKLVEFAKEYGWRYRHHWFPHDAKVEEWGTGRTRLESLMECGIKAPRLVPYAYINDGINAVRQILPQCYFNKELTVEGVRALKHYRKEWNEEMGCWRDAPRHDWASHGADAFRYLAMLYREDRPVDEAQPEDWRPPPGVPAIAAVTLDTLWQDQQRELQPSGLI